MAVNPPKKEELRVLSLFTVSSKFNITYCNQGDHCTVASLSNDNDGEIKFDDNQPEAVCDGINFNAFGESRLAKEILKASIHLWFGNKILS